MKNNFFYKALLGALAALLLFVFTSWQVKNIVQAANHCEVKQVGPITQTWCWYHLIVVADPVNLCIENKFMISPGGAPGAGYVAGFCPSSSPPPVSTPTPTPTTSGSTDVCANIAGTQTSVPDGLHLDASGQNCVSFELGGPSSGGSGGSTQGTSTGGQVLGASALGATGLAEERIMALTFALGGLLVGAGLRKKYAN